MEDLWRLSELTKLRKMRAAFAACLPLIGPAREGKELYVCHALYATGLDEEMYCRRLIMRALAGYVTLEGWMLGNTIPCSYSNHPRQRAARKRWVRQIIRDIDARIEELSS